MNWSPKVVWTPLMDALLMEAIAEGCTFKGAAEAAGVNKDQASSRFYRLAKELGWQAK